MIFDRCSISHFLSPISVLPFPISHFRSPISDLPFPTSYFYVPFGSSFVHFPWLLARPGGMRGTIESAALAVGRHGVSNPKFKPNRRSQICGSLSPPSAPAHSAEPSQNDHPTDFVIFRKHEPVPSELKHNCPRRTLIRVCI